MALPSANTTCDIYRNGNAPPAAPDVAALPCLFHACYDSGREHGEKENTARRYVAIMLVDLATDIRDPFNAWTTQVNTADTVYIPNMNGMGYQVNFVERISINRPNDCKCVYLDRLSVTWPYPPASISKALSQSEASEGAIAASASATVASNPGVGGAMLNSAASVIASSLQAGSAAIGASVSVIASSKVSASAGIAAAFTVLMSDTFTDTTGTTLSSHKPDYPVSGVSWGGFNTGTWTIQSNQAAQSDTGGTSGEQCTNLAQLGSNSINPGTTVSCAITTPSTGKTAGGILCWSDASGATAGYNFYMDSSAGFLYLYQSGTLRASASFTFSTSTTYQLTLKWDGTNIIGYVNGTQELSYTPSSGPTSSQTYFGLHEFRITTTPYNANTFDNFMVYQ